jgi:hypothetical protein
VHPPAGELPCASELASSPARAHPCEGGSADAHAGQRAGAGVSTPVKLRRATPPYPSVWEPIPMRLVLP